jgi:hypothetical protein
MRHVVSHHSTSAPAVAKNSTIAAMTATPASMSVVSPRLGLATALFALWRERVGVCVRKVIQVHYVVDDGREDEATDANQQQPRIECVEALEQFPAIAFGLDVRPHPTKDHGRMAESIEPA